MQMDQLGRLERPQNDLPFLAMMKPPSSQGEEIPSNLAVMVIDENRCNFDPDGVAQLKQLAMQKFGPIRLYLVPR